MDLKDEKQNKKRPGMAQIKKTFAYAEETQKLLNID